MIDPGTELLAFINQVRVAQGGDPIRYLVMLDADVDSEDECILAKALGVAVGGSHDPAWVREGRWVMRFADLSTARMVAVNTGQEWLPDVLEVALPDFLTDFATSAHFGLVERDDIGFVRSWHVPRDGDNLAAGFDCHWMPGMRLTSTVDALGVGGAAD